MTINRTFFRSLCFESRAAQPINGLRVTESSRSGTCFWRALLIMTALLLLTVPVLGQDQGEDGGSGGHEGGGGGGCGDVFGNLVHILRHERTGQPIFAQRWIELPGSEKGYGWGYCPVVVYTIDKVDKKGRVKQVHKEAGFLPRSCDLNPVDAEQSVEVNYFGRLNGGRTKERNNRMHFDEVISNITQADRLKLDPVGRLMMGFNCVEGGDCLWSTVDSPMESMSLYTRLMKYGHYATDPEERDTWAHGDPAQGTQYHPALSSKDWSKFEDAGLEHLLPIGNCWNGNEFESLCANPEALEREDFNSSAVLLAAAANKTGKITIDLVQYLNRFLKITQTTLHTESTLNTLPALYRDCWVSEFDPDIPEEGTALEDPEYENSEGCEATIVSAGQTPNYDLFSNIQERFMDFSESGYHRDDIEDAKADLILESLSIDDNWVRFSETSLSDWVVSVNGPDKGIGKDDIYNFVQAASDALRSIEYVHNYAVPENLYCKYKVEGFCPVD